MRKSIEKNIQNIIVMSIALMLTNLLMRLIVWASCTVMSYVEAGPLAIYLVLCLALQLTIILTILYDVVKIAVHFINIIKSKAIKTLKKIG